MRSSRFILPRRLSVGANTPGRGSERGRAVEIGGARQNGRAQQFLAQPNRLREVPVVGQVARHGMVRVLGQDGGRRQRPRTYPFDASANEDLAV
jgi:hypothetical protein